MGDNLPTQEVNSNTHEVSTRRDGEDSRRDLFAEPETPCKSPATPSEVLSPMKRASTLDNLSLQRTISLKRQKSIEREERGFAYTIWAFLASILMAVCSLLRSMVSDTPYDSFYAISFGDLTWTAVALAIFKCKLKSNFRMSWYQKQESASQQN